MARYIDADKAIELIKNYGKGAISDGLTTLDAVDDIVYLAKGVDLIPTADVVEVVRCKDCKHFMEYSEEYHGKVESADGDCFLRFINSVDKQFQAVCCNDFCSYGKRKEEG